MVGGALAWTGGGVDRRLGAWRGRATTTHWAPTTRLLTELRAPSAPSQRYNVPAAAGAAASSRHAIVSRPLTPFIARSVTLLSCLAKSLIGKRDRWLRQDVTDTPFRSPKPSPPSANLPPTRRGITAAHPDPT